MNSRTRTRLLPGLLAALIVSCLAPAHAAAQEAPDPKPPSRPTTVDVVFGGMLSYGGGGVDLRVSTAIPVSERKSIELFAGVSESGDVFDTRGVYGLQFRRMLGGKKADYQAYTSVGVMGLVARWKSRDCVHANCDWTSSNEVLPPLLVLFGGGVDFDVKPRLRMHLESQIAVFLFEPVSVRVGIGLSIPLGRTTPSNRLASR